MPHLKQIISQRRFIFLSLLLSVFFFNTAAYAGVDGAKIFSDNCARCHVLGKISTGPNLQNVYSRWQDTTKLYDWVHNPQAILNSGDKHTNDLYKQFGTVMQGFPSLTNEEITAVLHYVDAWKPAAGGGGNQPVTESKETNPTIYVILVFALLLIAIVLARVVRHLDHLVRQKYDEVEHHKLPWWRRKSYRPVIVLLILVAFCWLSYAMYDSASELGRQQGYEPEQPIAFSHKIHAGVQKIDCRYCHVGAERGKTAVIPSLSICMNCHYNIQSFSGNTPGYDPTKYTAEIQKIYHYAGFNPETNKYDKPATPVKWIKIHNLPDHVYFNHSQHVKVAGLECQTCHGPIETMDVVKQQENLSMGWCVNCHRNTSVHFTDNDFYKPYEELHRKLESGEIKDVKAADIGATDCQRCHY